MGLKEVPDPAPLASREVLQACAHDRVDQVRLEQVILFGSLARGRSAQEWVAGDLERPETHPKG